MPNSAPQHHLTVVANPRSGRGRAGGLLGRIERAFKEGLPDSAVEIVLSKSFEDAFEQAHRVAHAAEPPHYGERRDTLVMVGGDGMAHVGINGAAGSSAELGIVPAGTGDDFSKGVGIKRDPMKAVGQIIEGKTRSIDALKVTGGPNGDFLRYCGSIISSGWDARINAKVNARRINLGKLSYFASMFTEMVSWRAVPYRLIIDGEPYELDAILVAIGNAGFFGGGIPICPFADPDDGVLDLTIVHKASRVEFFKTLGSLYTGKFIKNKYIEIRRAHTVELDGDGLIPMADGEALTAAPLTCSAVANALTLIADPKLVKTRPWPTTK